MWHNHCFLKASVGDVRHFGRCAWRCCWARFLPLFGCFGTAPQSSCSAMCSLLCFLRASVGDVGHFGRCAWGCCWARFLLLFGCFGTYRSSELMFCDGLAGVAKSLCFLRASVGDVRHFGRCASWGCCWARFLLLFGCFGTAPQSSCSAMCWLVWQNPLCFLRASVGDVRHFGRCAWGCCWARFLLLLSCFGTAPQSSCSAMGWLVWQKLFVFLGLQ